MLQWLFSYALIFATNLLQFLAQVVNEANYDAVPICPNRQSCTISREAKVSYNAHRLVRMHVGTIGLHVAVVGLQLFFFFFFFFKQP
jgi:hypothetical protein